MLKKVNILKIFVMFCVMFSITSLTEASENVAYLYINKAETNCNEEIDLKINNAVKDALSGAYNIVDGKKYLYSLEKIGITDVSLAERNDIIDVFQNDPVDYVVFIELNPFIRKEKFTFFTQGMDMTATLEVKIVDLHTKRYLYVGKVIEKASDSTMLGSVGNKSVQLKAIDKVMDKFIPIMKAKLPYEQTSEKKYNK